VEQSGLCRYDGTGRYLCYVAGSQSPSSLPGLTFRLSEDGPPLLLPLGDLLLPPDADGRRPLCVIRYGGGAGVAAASDGRVSGGG
jgi:hypothetical protein